MTTERYQPSPDEIVEGRLMMTPEQKELSAVREIFVESEHRIAELPLDFEYDLMGVVNATGQRRGRLSGTFDGKKVQLQKSSWESKGDNWSFSGKTIDNEKLPDDEARSLYESIYPAAEAYDKMLKAQSQAAQQLRGEVKAAQQQHQLEVGQARKEGFVEGEESGKIKGILEKRLQETEVGDEDREFLETIIEQVAQLYGTDEPKTEREQRLEKLIGQQVGVMARQREQSDPDNTYNRRRELLLKVFGTTEPQKWVAGFGTEYIHSLVYPTTIPGLVVREGYDRKELPSAADARITIERNSRFQKEEATEAA